MPHYYSEKQFSELNLKLINVNVKNIEFELYTASGIFSKKKIDKGTKLLIENCIIEPEWSILDLGCGIGVIGITIKLLHPNTKITMVDINERAVMISKKNIQLNDLNIKLKKSNLFEKIQAKFNTILINPPQTAGKDICFKIIEDSKKHLKKNGLLQLVARHQKGGKSLKEKMHLEFGNVKEIAKGSGYRIYVSKYLSINAK